MANRFGFATLARHGRIVLPALDLETPPQPVDLEASPGTRSSGLKPGGAFGPETKPALSHRAMAALAAQCP
jgi:hypothetical protein